MLKNIFINHDGDVFPCCRLLSRPQYRVGSIRDSDIADRIIEFDKECSCETYSSVIIPEMSDQVETGYSLVKATSTAFNSFNIEFGLTCNAQCAMCCVHAPEWRGTYELYDDLLRLIDRLRPGGIAVQGGEVLAQARTLDFLATVKGRFPSMRMHIITNGNAPLSSFRLFNVLFETATFSIVGFTDNTYRTIMGLDFDKTKAFIGKVLEAGKCKVSLKYLVTPLNVHEAHLFLDWAVRQKPASIQIADSNFMAYTKEDGIRFWSAVVERSGRMLRKAITRNAAMIGEAGIELHAAPSLRTAFGLDESYVAGVRQSASAKG
jgi:pyruvate-formate lyase-activating enzyme